VATDVGGLPEVISNTGAGFICSKNDVLDFANRIIELLENPELSKNMGKLGQEHVSKNFTDVLMAKSYRALLE